MRTFCFAKDLGTATTAKDVFDTLDDFMRNNGINWTNYIGVCTDSATTMTGRHAGVVQRIEAVAPCRFNTLFFLHRDVLAAKDIEPRLHEVMNTAVTIVNFVKARATNSRLFTALCEEVGADHHSLFMHTGEMVILQVDAHTPVQPKGGAMYFFFGQEA